MIFYLLWAIVLAPAIIICLIPDGEEINGTPEIGGPFWIAVIWAIVIGMLMSFSNITELSGTGLLLIDIVFAILMTVVFGFFLIALGLGIRWGIINRLIRPKVFRVTVYSIPPDDFQETVRKIVVEKELTALSVKEAALFVCHVEKLRYCSRKILQFDY